MVLVVRMPKGCGLTMGVSMPWLTGEAYGEKRECRSCSLMTVTELAREPNTSASSSWLTSYDSELVSPVVATVVAVLLLLLLLPMEEEVVVEEEEKEVGMVTPGVREDVGMAFGGGGGGEERSCINVVKPGSTSEQRMK